MEACFGKWTQALWRQELQQRARTRQLSHLPLHCGKIPVPCRITCHARKCVHVSKTFLLNTLLENSFLWLIRLPPLLKRPSVGSNPKRLVLRPHSVTNRPSSLPIHTQIIAIHTLQNHGWKRYRTDNPAKKKLKNCVFHASKRYLERKELSQYPYCELTPKVCEDTSLRYMLRHCAKPLIELYYH